MCTVLHNPINWCASLTFFGGGQFVIALILPTSGLHPSTPTSYPRIVTLDWQIWSFFPEKVPSASVSWCKIWLRSIACSQISV